MDVGLANYWLAPTPTVRLGGARGGDPGSMFTQASAALHRSRKGMADDVFRQQRDLDERVQIDPGFDAIFVAQKD